MPVVYVMEVHSDYEQGTVVGVFGSLRNTLTRYAQLVEAYEKGGSSDDWIPLGDEVSISQWTIDGSEGHVWWNRRDKEGWYEIIDEKHVYASKVI